MRTDWEYSGIRCPEEDAAAAVCGLLVLVDEEGWVPVPDCMSDEGKGSSISGERVSCTSASQITDDATLPAAWKSMDEKAKG